jgi:hypothetical protein
MDLGERLDFEINNNPDKYSRQTIERVSKLVKYEVQNPYKRKPYKILEDITDFQLYHALHPEWEGKNTNEIKKEGNESYYVTLQTWCRKESIGDKKKYEELLTKIFPRQHKDWTKYTTMNQWMEQYNAHPTWFGKNTGEMQKEKEGHSFYSQFRKWCEEESKGNKEKYEELMKQIFPNKQKDCRTFLRQYDWSGYTTIDKWIEHYDKHSEWKGKNTSEMTKEGESEVFYRNFRKWCRKESNGEKEKYEELMKQVFPRQISDWSKYRINKTIDDWAKEHDKHPEWKGKNTREIRKEEEGHGFYITFQTWCRKESKGDKERYEELITTIFPREHNDWTRYEAIDQWIEHYNKHPEWFGKNTRAILHDEGGRAFYKSFQNWCRTESKIDESMYKSLLRAIFPEKKAPFKYMFGDELAYFDSNPERIVGIILNQTGAYNPVEGENLHVRTNGSKLHSIDFLVDKTFIEYHPVGIMDKKRNVSLEEAGERKKKHITNPKFTNYEFHHIWEIGQLYDILRTPSINSILAPEYRDMDKDKFDGLVMDAYHKSIEYDTKNSEEKKMA